MQFAQKLFQHVALGRFGGEQQFLRGHVLRVVILEDELEDDLAGQLGTAAFEHVVFRADEAAGADEEHLDDGVGLLGTTAMTSLSLSWVEMAFWRCMMSSTARMRSR